MVNGNQPKYAAVDGEPGKQILSYQVYFPRGTGLAQARAIVLQEFPRGAKFGIADKDEPACLIVEVRSPQVEAGMAGYGPAVAFFTDPDLGDLLVLTHVDNAVMTLVAKDETTDLGGC